MDGELVRCQSPFVVFNNDCVESSEVQRDAQRMFEELHTFVATTADQLFCRSKIPGWIPDTDGAEAFKEGKLLSKAEFRSALRRKSVW